MDEAQIQAAPQMQQQQHVQLEDKNTRTLFLRNVDYNATEDDLRNNFGTFLQLSDLSLLSGNPS